MLTSKPGLRHLCRHGETIALDNTRQMSISGLQLDREQLLEAYRRMRTIRVFEETVREEFEAGRMPGFVHLYAGEEAVAVGVCMHLDDADRIVSTHRGHGHCIAKGVEVPGMMKELHARRDGVCHGKGGSMHIADLDRGMMGANAIVGAGAPLACGAALAAKTLGTGKVGVSFLGDGAANQGAVLESLNLASIWSLPVVFVFENNGYAESTASSWAIAGGEVVRRAEAFAMPGHSVDGTDFFAVFDAMGQAIDRARRGEGPSLIEARTVRFFGHHEGDSQTYRGTNEVESARADRDCLVRFRERVLGAKLLDPAGLDAEDTAITTMVANALAAARAAPPPEPGDLTADVYVSY